MKEIPVTSGHMLPTQLGRGLKQAAGGPCTSIAFNAIVPLGSPNTNLHYLVTMETGAACQPYSQTRACFLSAAALGLREAGGEYRVRFPNCHSPREVAHPREVDLLPEMAWGERSERREKDVPARYLLFCFRATRNVMPPQTLTPLPKASPESRPSASHAVRSSGHVKQPQGRCVLRPEGTVLSSTSWLVLACPCPQGLTQSVSDHQSWSNQLNLSWQP